MKNYKYKINGNLYNVTVKDVEDQIAHLEVNGTPYEVELDKPAPRMIAKPAAPKAQAIQQPTAQSAAPVAAASSAAKGASVKSPLPGVVKNILVKAGDMVKRGQPILVLEAMKMENNINSDKDGKVVDIKVNKGDSVLEGADLIIIE